MKLNNENIQKVLKTIYDPEIPLNIVDLGLIYEIAIEKDNKIRITMTLTTMGCPAITDFIDSIKSTLKEKFTNQDILVDLTFDPPWNPNMINKDALEELGISE